MGATGCWLPMRWVCRRPVRELPADTDAVAFVASLNIHRRHLTATQRSASAARLLKLSHAAFRDNHPDEPDPDKLVSPIANDPVLAASGPAEPDSSEAGAAESSPRAQRPSRVPVTSPRPSADADDGNDGDDDVEPAVPLPGQQVDLTEDNSPVLSARKVALRASKRPIGNPPEYDVLSTYYRDDDHSQRVEP